jgi:hypothetical protein
MSMLSTVSFSGGKAMRRCGLAMVLCSVFMLEHALAQAPAIPAAPAAAAPAAAALQSAATTAPSTPMNLWGFLFPSRQQIKDFNDTMDDCHKKCCDSPIGQLLNNSTKSLTLMSGGLVPPLCPASPAGPNEPGKPNPDDLNKPADSAQGAAARIKQQEAEAAERRQAVRFLGTVDCQRFPEAEAALVKSLREDTNECVRWEAAKALGHGCCCTKKTIDALTLTVNASQKDGNPAEKSERVRATALESLQHCLMCYEERKPDETDRPEKPTKPESAKPMSSNSQSVILTAYDAKIAAERYGEVIARAREAVRRNSCLASAGPLPSGQRSLATIVSHAVPQPGQELTPAPNRPASYTSTSTAGPAPTPPATPPAKAAPKGPRSFYSVIRSAAGS